MKIIQNERNDKYYDNSDDSFAQNFQEAPNPQSMFFRNYLVFVFTGMIWARYSLVIIPKNYSLFAVNLFVGLTGLYQLGRIYK